MRLKIIGTSHIAQQSVQEIKKAFNDFKPDIISVELDVDRAKSLFQPQTQKMSWSVIFKVGVKGFLFAKIAQYVQQKLGQSVGISPGSEMKTAMELAQKNKLQIAFIDQPISITLKKLSQRFSWKEKWHFFSDIMQSIFRPKKMMKQWQITQFDLHKVPEKEIILKLVSQLQERYPSVYLTLVEERNKYMSQQLIKLLRHHPEKRILAVVGAGHEKGMNEYLLKVDFLYP
ncbi:TraB/GumN family protein [Candidatus Woesearchaeota archaeon]|nr:TraB/GumN family protein [Candidatus Woesearchaeota archaeon]